MFSDKKNQLPAVCTESGAVRRKKLPAVHFDSTMHKKCVKMELCEKVMPSRLGEADSQKNKIKTMFGSHQAAVAQKVVQLLYTVFNDAKRGTLI